MTDTAHDTVPVEHTPAAEAPGAASQPTLSPADVEAAVNAVGDRARRAARQMARANRAWKDRALRAIGAALKEKESLILAANERDLEAGRANGTSKALLDRLALTPARIDGLVGALENLAGLPDPVGNVVRGQTLPNGLRLRQVNVPMGVVAAIYEARPNVTVDIAGLALKSGNAVILRGGSAAAHTNTALVDILRDTLAEVGLPADAVQSVDAYGREGANVLMKARGRVDVLIPRGGHELIQSVVLNSTVPVIETGEGNVHIFVDESADEEMAVDILLNAKTQRPSVCNTVETLLVHRDSTVLPALARALAAKGVRLHVDGRTMEALPESRPSTRSMTRSSTSAAGARATLRPSSRTTCAARSASWPRSTRRRSSSTPRRASPTAASWGSAPRWASRRRSSTPVGPWA